MSFAIILWHDRGSLSVIKRKVKFVNNALIVGTENNNDLAMILIA